MKQNDFYEVDGCMDFIPVKLIEEHKYMTKPLKVKLTETGYTTFVPHMYRFPKINEPQKVVLPKFVAEWIEYCKHDKFYTLHVAYANMDYRLKCWCFNGNNSELFAKAWLYGYEVEKEKGFMEILGELLKVIS